MAMTQFDVHSWARAGLFGGLLRQRGCYYFSAASKRIGSAQLRRSKGSWSGHAIAAVVFLTQAIDLSHAQITCVQDPTVGDCKFVLPPVCSRNPAASTAPAAVCDVTTPAELSGGKRVQVTLKAVTDYITVGGYTVRTENYNTSYLSPVIEANAGDSAAAAFENSLDKPSDLASSHGHGATENPTNLHFFHGGVVVPKNSRRANDPNDAAAKMGSGDNVYTYWKRGDPSFTYEVPIPSLLDGRVIDIMEGRKIPHPNGLNWYHSHLHGYSSDQIMGGLSGLLSVGEADANVVACRKDLADPSKCNDDPNATIELKARTDARYALLRDIALQDISALPDAITTMPKTATWAPKFNGWTEGRECGVWTAAGGSSDDKALRKGYCQRDKENAWLFTVNGQRFPTIRVEGGRNLLLRLGNLSPNVVYWLELYNENNEADREKLLLVGIDGVVPAKVVSADPNRQPVRATPVEDLVLMPASRAEIFIRNDCLRPQEQTYILRTKGLKAGTSGQSDRWPEIQLMRIVLEKSTVSCIDDIALNAVAGLQLVAVFAGPLPQVVTKPKGCVDDIDPKKAEHRRVTFKDVGGMTSSGVQTAWNVLTEIVRPPDPSKAAPYNNFVSDIAKRVGREDPDDGLVGIPFEEYDLGDGKIDWDNTNGARPHVCIFAEPGNSGPTSGHQQLWVLKNDTGHLHNFHIHQMKFRLATATELADKFKIEINPTNEPPEVCADQPDCKLKYKLYEASTPDANTTWHDTIPMPPAQRVYVVMSFVAEQQVGRYVFHCHILKHEDNGLMAPIEVWKPTPVVQ
jgi:FtsP/CotA-like multicopper oxidase with cupredoxin domain